MHSPTFTLVNEYEGKISLYHADFYRLERESEVKALGLEEYVKPEGVLVIEWAEKFPDALPEPRLEIILRAVSDMEREIRFSKAGILPMNLQKWMKQTELQKP